MLIVRLFVFLLLEKEIGLVVKVEFDLIGLV